MRATTVRSAPAGTFGTNAPAKRSPRFGSTMIAVARNTMAITPTSAISARSMRAYIPEAKSANAAIPITIAQTRVERPNMV